jgi:hypothetical protein
MVDSAVQVAPISALDRTQILRKLCQTLVLVVNLTLASGSYMLGTLRCSDIPHLVLSEVCVVACYRMHNARKPPIQATWVML